MLFVYFVFIVGKALARCCLINIVPRVLVCVCVCVNIFLCFGFRCDKRPGVSTFSYKLARYHFFPDPHIAYVYIVCVMAWAF